MPSPEPLSKEWIGLQLALCKTVAKARSTMLPCLSLHRHSIHVAYLAAVRDGYPLVLRELLDFYASFALYSKACHAGRKLFLEAHPEFGDLTDPDTGEMVAWLVEEIKRLREVAGV